VQAELTLWDLAGQPECCLTHQLFLDDTDAALLLFDCSDPNDPRTGEMTVNSRKREKPDGAWSADARWGDKNNPRPWYHFAVPHYRSRG
jgi:hypothetical protein